MIEQITTRKNMLRAMYRVQKNKGSSGLDKLPVEDLPELLAIDRENLIDMVLSGKYLPQPILGVQIPKDNGGKRLFGHTNSNRPLASTGSATGHQCTF
jgi:RNA-directed DNA polymerase